MRDWCKAIRDQRWLQALQNQRSRANSPEDILPVLLGVSGSPKNEPIVKTAAHELSDDVHPGAWVPPATVQAMLAVMDAALFRVAQAQTCKSLESILSALILGSEGESSSEPVLPDHPLGWAPAPLLFLPTPITTLAHEFPPMPSSFDHNVDLSCPDFVFWQERVLASPKAGLIVTFLYHRSASLVYSIQDRRNGKYYDFATKGFVAKPMIPRAAFEARSQLGSSWLYGASIGRSGQLHGEYLVCVRDMDQGGALVAVLAYRADNGTLSLDSLTSITHLAVEDGLPPTILGESPVRTGRGIELD